MFIIDFATDTCQNPPSDAARLWLVGCMRSRTRSTKEIAMASITTPEKLLGILRETIVGTVRRDGPDLSARQMAVFLICYLEEGPHTVRGLAARLDVSKPAVTRSLDRLAELSLARRAVDPRDRRSVVVLRTRKGNEFLADVRALMAAASRTRGPNGGGHRQEHPLAAAG
jgi:DNA-binding MarR family transcriptional regulator